MKKSSRRTSEESEKTPYKSKYKEGYINAQNYIVELIFEKRNNHFNQGKAPESFWNSEKYQGIYKKELFGVNRLLKLYHADSVIKAFTSPEAKYILKIAYNRTWDDKKFVTENSKLFSIIRKFESMRVEKEIVKVEVKQEEVAKPFSPTKKTNIFKDL
jgi:hypothetical protein